MAVAEADEQRRAVVAHLVGHEYEQRVADRRNRDSLAGIVRQSAFSQCLHALQSRKNQTQREQQEERSRARCDAHRFLAVDGEIIAQNTVAEAETNHIHRQQPPFHKEESVERNGFFILQNLPFAWLNRRIDKKSECGDGKSHPKKQVEIVEIAIDENADRRCDGRCDVVAQSVVADALIAPRRWQHVDGHCTVGDACRAEGCAVQRPDDGEKQQRRGQQIGSEAQKIDEQACEQHFFSWKTVGHVAAERSDEQCRERVARQHESNHILRSAEVLAEVERQQWRKQIEGKCHREIRRHHLPVVRVPESFVVVHLLDCSSLQK